jgi:hypothetical protein
MNQPGLFVDRAEHRERIALACAQKFPTYGAGSPPANPNNGVANTLKNQPLQFAMGVHVMDVVNFVADELERGLIGYPNGPEFTGQTLHDAVSQARREHPLGIGGSPLLEGR